MDLKMLYGALKDVIGYEVEVDLKKKKLVVIKANCARIIQTNCKPACVFWLCIGENNIIMRERSLCFSIKYKKT